jgi:hypothetical protein
VDHRRFLIVVKLYLWHSVFIQGTAQGLEVNIAGCIYTVLIIIGLFIGTGYLIDNRIDM